MNGATRIADLHKSAELDIACNMLKQAILKADVCGYSRTVKEQYAIRVRNNWKAYAKKHTIRGSV